MARWPVLGWERTTEYTHRSSVLSLQKDKAAQTDFWRNATQGGHQRGANRPVAKAKSTRHGSRRGRTPRAQSSAQRAPSGSQQEKRRNPQEEHAKNRGPQKEKQPREAALERTQPALERTPL